jgi:hypothetical protein
MPRRYLLGLLLAFAVLATGYSLATPLFEAPDEPWHYAYIRWVAEGHGLPRLDDPSSGANQEVAQPPLYYALAALVSSPVDDGDLAALFWHNPQFGYQAGGTVNDNKNMLIHTEQERFPWRGAVLAIRLARLASLLFGLLTVLFTYGLAREVWPSGSWLPLLVAGVVAFTPQFLFISGVASNDSAAAAACTLALWALARILRRGITRRRAAAAGLALGLALLSKTSAVALVPLGLLVLWMTGRHMVVGPEGEERLKGRANTTGAALLMLGVAGLVGGWWYIRNGILFGDPLGLNVHVNTPWGRATPASLGTLLSELPQVFRSFWGAFGWGHVQLPGFVYLMLGGLVLLAVAGWIRPLILWLRRRGDTAAEMDASTHAISSTAAIYLLLGGWCGVVLVALLRWMQQVQAPHGRLLFPALGGWALLLVAGWSGLSRNRTLSALPVAALLTLSLVVPSRIIRPAFAQPALVSAVEAAERVTPHIMVYDGRVRLLGYRVEPERVTAGEQVKVTLCWEAIQAIQQDYTLFIHLLGRDNLRVGERTTYPGQGRFPTSLWPAGRAFCDAYWVPVAPWAPGPEMYGLEVGLYDAETGWRLPSESEAGQAVAPPILTLVRVLPGQPLPQPDQAASYELGGQIALVGYGVGRSTGMGSTATLQQSETYTLTLFWKALQKPQGDYKVFAHLLDGTGSLVAQDDAVPRDGRYPTWAWQPDDVVPDVHQVTLTDAAPNTGVRWAVGLYDPETNDRLPVIGPQGPVPDGAIILEMGN